MSIEEQWQQMRKATTATEQQLLEQFIPWTEEFTAAENDTNGAFDHWRSLDKDTRLGLFRNAVGNLIRIDYGKYIAGASDYQMPCARGRKNRSPRPC